MQSCRSRGEVNAIAYLPSTRNVLELAARGAARRIIQHALDGLPKSRGLYFVKTGTVAAAVTLKVMATSRRPPIGLHKKC